MAFTFGSGFNHLQTTQTLRVGTSGFNFSVFSGSRARQRVADAPRVERASSYNDLTGTLRLYGKPIADVCGNAPLIGEEIYTRGVTADADGVERYTGIWSFGHAREGSRLVKLWIGNLLVFNGEDQQNVLKHGGLQYRFNPGGSNQAADPIIVSDYPSTPWANRWLTTVTIQDWDIANTDGKKPAAVKAEIWDNFSEATSTVTVSGTNYPANNGLAMDWDTRIAYAFGPVIPRVMYAIDADDNTLLYSITIDPTNAQMNSLNGTVQYAVKHPNLPHIVASCRDENDDVRLYAIDQFSGAILHRSAVIGGGFSILMGFSVVQPDAGGDFYCVCILPTLYDSEIVRYDGATFTELVTGPTNKGELIVTGKDDQSGTSTVYFVNQANTAVIRVDVDGDGGISESTLFSDSSIDRISYAPKFDMLCVDYTGGIYVVIDGTSGAVLYNGTTVSSRRLCWHPSERVTDFFAFVDVSPSDYTLLDLNTFTQSTGSLSYTTNAVMEALHDGDGQSIWTMNVPGASGTQRLVLSDITASRYTLKADLEKRAGQVGLAAADYDFTAVTNSIDFSVLLDNISYSQYLKDAARLFGYQLVVSDKIRLHALPTSGSPTIDATLTSQDLVSLDGAGIQTSDDATTDVIYNVEVSYIAGELEYDWSVASAKRSIFPKQPNSKSRPLRVRAPFGITEDEAISLGAKLLYRENQARTSHSFTLGMRDMDKQAASLVDITGKDGATLRTYVDVSNSFDWASRQWKFEGRSYLDTHALTYSGSAGATLPDNTLGRPATAVESLAIPLLDTSLDQNGAGLVTYFAVTSRGQSQWSGGRGYYSLDNGLSWNLIGTQTSDPTTGRVTAALATTSTPDSVDTTNSFTVRRITGSASDLASISQAVFDAKGGDYIAIGAHGRWEIIMARDVVDNGDGTYTLDHLHRAQFGTEPYIAGHAVADTFVVLKSTYLKNAVIEHERLGDTIKVVGAGIGESPFDGTAKSHVLTGEAEKAYLPSNVAVSSPDGDSLNITWTEPTSTFVDEEKYRVQVLDGPFGNVLETYGEDGSITTESLTLSLDQIVSVFGQKVSNLRGYVAHGTDIDGLWGHNRYFDKSTGLLIVNLMDFLGGTAMPYSGVKVYRSTAWTGQNFTGGWTSIPFDTEDHDTDNWHDNATNNTRLSVPSDHTHAIFFANPLLQNVAANAISQFRILLNGTTQIAFAEAASGGANRATCLVTSPIAVTGGTDYVTFQVQQLGGDTSVDVSTTTTFGAIGLAIGASSELTIASGAVTATKFAHTIDTESDVASDDLDTINGGVDGYRLVLKAENSARTVVVKNGTGNIHLAGSDFSLTHARDRIELIYDSSESAWCELSRADNAA